MKKCILFILVVLILHVANAQPYSGNYTIGGSNPDWTAIQPAIDSLVLHGVNGPVVLNIRDGVYNGLLNFTLIPGVSDINTITFQSESGDSSAVEIWGATTTQTTVSVRLQQSRYLRFKRLSFRQASSPNNSAIVFIVGGRHIQFENCLFWGASGSSGTEKAISSAIDTGLVVRKCAFQVCETAVYSGNFLGNSWYDLIENNTINAIWGHGVFINGSIGSVVRNNYINAASGNTTKGIFVQSASRYELSGNTIENFAGVLNSCGIQIISSGGWPTWRSRVYNNSISMQCGTTHIAYGFRCSSSTNLEIYHNTIRITGGPGGYAFYLDAVATAGNELWIKNNNLARMDTISNGYCIRIPNAAAYAPYFHCDYNNLYSESPWISNNIATLNDYIALNLTDTNSISEDPQFVSNTNLMFTNPFLENAATPVFYITTDIHGLPRDPLMPDIGAFETANPPVVSLGPDTVVCDSILFQFNYPGATIVWSNGVTGNSIVVDSTGWVSVSVSHPLGTASDSVFVTVHPTPDVMIAANQPMYCVGDSALLTVTSSLPGIWNWADTAWSSTLRPVEIIGDTIFEGVFISTGNCSASAMVSLNVYTPTPIFFEIQDSVLCIDAGLYPLIASPSGGTFSGALVTGNNINTNGILPQWTTVVYAYTDSNMCLSELSDSVSLEICTGAVDVQSERMYLKVNADEVQLMNDYSQYKVWYLLDANGSIVFQLAGNQSSLNLSSLSIAPGMYLVRCQSNTGDYTAKCFRP